ncbi:MAG TPA: winged helix-turn-helix domain-containing protein [Candidatus Sulfotelmatobacter sp.]|nr:winged helix-turn-helix domain-containing protein [Candidatus Sulfotelmatobacter sp.]
MTPSWRTSGGASSRISHGERVYRIGALSLDADRLVVLANGTPVALAPKAVATLALLVERAGTPVAKDEFLDTIWSDADVGEATLAQNVYLLRRTLRLHGLDGAIRTLRAAGTSLPHRSRATRRRRRHVGRHRRRLRRGGGRPSR